MIKQDCKIPIVQKLAAIILAVIIFNIAIYYSDCQGQMAFNERIHFNVGSGWSNYNMKRGFIGRDFNDDFVYTEYHVKRIEGGREYYGEVIFDYLSNFSFGAGILYSKGNRNLSEWIDYFLDDYSPPPKPDPVIYEASLMSPYLKLGYSSTKDIINYSANANVYYGFAALEADIYRAGSLPPVISYDRIRFESRGMGYSLSMGISFKLTRGFSIINNVGYRNLSVGELEDPDGNKLASYDLNYSGYFIRGGLSVNPWGK